MLFWVLPQTPSLSQVILIDPGHGGEDCGAKTVYKKKKHKPKNICEKDLALRISKKIQSKLKRKYQVYLTRTHDRTLSLEERAGLADKIKADIFVSVHLNSVSSKRGHGYETYYLDNHKDEAVKKIESIENRSAKGEELIINQILADLVIQRTAPSSKRLASLIHKNITKRVKSKFKLTDRGTKPALFYVLALSKRPSVLLEAGFISHSKEIEKVLSDSFQNRYADGVARGIREYFKKKKKFSLF
ncbi:MAG: N-acetylmuramoyl-L-alanine amidase [Bacteriovoracaceae bacterium]|nr:N-acetylmuramoyl-L-alanine amidase [Bacteriovoracaceae bacterium]